ncbi:hypothetical protein MFIFM68171_05627 [Madurella fahalii]|uniref:Polysaccharide lyase family 20 protein n=1 Tax=Madurella fahalii TaxID=1157608 RepID=A0ABQ0GCE7_9PEZI
MYAQRLFLSALTAASPAVVWATQLFSNHGTTSGWSASYIDAGCGGTIQQVTNVIKEGSTALKMTHTHNPNYNGLYHAEVHAYDGYSQGQTRFYGFWFRLSEAWEFTPGESFNIAQFIANFPGTCDEWMPSTMVWISGNQLWARRKHGSLCPQSSQQTNNINTGRTVTAGVWHKIVIQAKWESDSTGYFKLWFDGDKVIEELYVPTTIQQDSPFQFRVGLYANGWSNGGYSGNQPFRQIWFDEIGFGTTFADADPDQW